MILTNHRYTDHNAISSIITFPTVIVLQKGPKFKWKRFHGDEVLQKHFHDKLYSLYHNPSSHTLRDMYDTLQTVNTNIDNNDIMHRIFIVLLRGTTLL